MNANTYAVLVGINQYSDHRLASLRFAEKDCDDMYGVLTDPQKVGIPPSNVFKLVGSEATCNNVQRALFVWGVRDRKPDDRVIVYYSGHGFLIPSFGKAYLATCDVAISTLLENPMAGVSMEYLHEEVFRKSRAKEVIFFIDACYSGAIVPTSIRDLGPASLLDERFGTTGSGRVAIVSSPPDVQSREGIIKSSPQEGSIGNGFFTYHLINGLSGEAAEPTTGDVTVDSLMAYVRNHAPLDQPPGRYGQDFGRIVLAKLPGQRAHPSQQLSQLRIDLLDLQKYADDASQALEFTEITNPLDGYAQCIRTIADLLTDESPIAHLSSETRILEAIRRSIDSEILLLLRRDEEGWQIKSASGLEAGSQARESIERLVARVRTVLLRRESAFDPTQFGVHALVEDEGHRNTILMVPLNSPSPDELLIAHGLQQDSRWVSEPFSHILRAIYSASRGFEMVNGPVIEANVLDQLKQFYKYVPLSFYERRFELFVRQLNRMDVRFQPVISLSRAEPYIGGYEALALDPEQSRSPRELFATAEAWGRRFIIELDMYFLQFAVHKYRRLLAGTPGRRRPEDLLDLSINVYPESLLRTSYYEQVAELIRGELMPPDKLFLEISEKLPLPVPVYGEGIATESGDLTFRAVLERYVGDLGIGFAMDDFGVGYSSVSRLAELHPSYVKIDRELLLQEYVYDTVKFVSEFVRDLISKRHLRSAKMVIEGFDAPIARRVKLSQLYALGVRFLQGYIIGEPGEGLARLDQQGRDFLKSLIMEQ